MNTDEYTIYFPETPDAMFYRSALSTIMRLSENLKLDCGKYADRITFKGTLGKMIYDNFTEKKYNLGATLRHVDSMDDEIVLDRINKVKIAKSDVIREIGFEYTVEKEIKPELIIRIIKPF